MFNHKDFNLQDIIKKRVNIEAEIEHAPDPRPRIPKVEVVRIKTRSAGFINLLRELQP